MVVIKRSLKKWREDNPDAKEANISGRKDITDADFVYLEGIQRLNMKNCDQKEITDAAFKHLKSVKTLIMFGCNQKEITDEAFKHLENIKELNMEGCDQDTITDKAFENFKNLTKLEMKWCKQKGITDKAFENLKKVIFLDMTGCNQPAITDAAFKNLNSVKYLEMEACSQDGITDKAFSYLRDNGIRSLNISYCKQRGITDKIFEYLEAIRILKMEYCDQDSITGDTLYKLISPEAAADYDRTGDVGSLDLELLNVAHCNKQTRENAYDCFGVGIDDDGDVQDTIVYYDPPVVPDEPEPPENNSKKWSGFTQADIKNLDAIFGKDGINYTLCPICLAYSIRQDGCMYMYHNCKKIKESEYHKDLYKEYLDTSRTTYPTADMVEWCTICNRITKNHRHFKLSSADERHVGRADKPRNTDEFFQNDCTGIGGGGFREKLARFKRYAEFALELQEEKGKLSEKEAKYKLIEEVWNAPLYVDNRNLNDIIATKNLGNKSRFPLKNNTKSNGPRGDEPNAPNIPFEGKLPTKAGKGFNNVTMDDDVELYEFHHKQRDGKVQKHTISIEGLKDTIEATKGRDGFGACFKQPECNATIHPEELKSLIEEGFPKTLYEEYKKEYNREFQVGGSRGIQMGGGMIVEATDAMCVLPPKRHSRTRSRRGGNRRNTRRKMPATK